MFRMKRKPAKKNGTVKPYKVIPKGAKVYRASDFEERKTVHPFTRDFLREQFGLSDQDIDALRR
jgi:hypothetical protein